MTFPKIRPVHFWSLPLLFASFAVMTIFFQNCTQPVSTTGVSALESEAAGLELAYDVSHDQIAYMSCNQMDRGSYDESAYFSFRVGAYREGGLKISDWFRTAQADRPLEKQVELLTMSPANIATAVQISLRLLSNYQSLVIGEGSPLAGKDYQNIFMPLGDWPISQALLAQPENSSIRYLRDGTARGARFEGSLHFSKSAESIRQYLTNEAFLAATFTHNDGTSGGETAARSPGHVIEGSGVNVARSVYGRGYKLSFSQPSVSGIYGQFPTVVLSGVSELNTLNSSQPPGGTWTCPESMQFRIVRAQDIAIAAANCDKTPDPPEPSADLAIVRNSLREEDWFVNMEQKCIVPKKTYGACYGSFEKIVYDMSKTCQPSADNMCLAFASVCYRTN